MKEKIFVASDIYRSAAPTFPPRRRRDRTARLAGELVDFDSLFLPSIDYNVQAISDCEMSIFSCGYLTDLIFDYPQIGKALFRETLIKAAISREWMANLGRRDSRTKVSYLLCELSVRLSQVSGTHSHDFELPITQEQISDIIGCRLSSLLASGQEPRHRDEIRHPQRLGAAL